MTGRRGLVAVVRKRHSDSVWSGLVEWGCGEWGLTVECGPAGGRWERARSPLLLPQRTLLRSIRRGYVRVAGIEDGTARGPPVFGGWGGGAWGAVGRGHMAAGPACRYLFQTAWSKES